MRLSDLHGYIPIMDIDLYFVDDNENDIIVSLTDINANGEPPTITVTDEGGVDLPEEEAKKYRDYVLQMIKEEKFQLPHSISIDPLNGKVDIDECMWID